MTLTKEAKLEIIGRHGRSQEDTGSPQVQIALLTQRINELHGAPPGASEGPLLAARTAQARRPPPPIFELSPDATTWRDTGN